MSKSHWMIADEAARYFAERRGEALANGEPETMAMMQGLTQLAVVVRDTAERVGLRAEGVEIPPLEVGQEYELLLRVRARVVDVSDGHGVCYELQLEQRDFYSGRTVSVDHNEVSGADKVQ